MAIVYHHRRLDTNTQEQKDKISIAHKGKFHTIRDW